MDERIRTIIWIIGMCGLFCVIMFGIVEAMFPRKFKIRQKFAMSGSMFLFAILIALGIQYLKM